MKKIKLSQPYASMVVMGILETLPDIWEKVKYGEIIFIYAEDIDEQLKDGLDYAKPLHRKIFNETFLGNIPEREELPTQCFIGCVRVYYKGKMTAGWTESHKKTIFVSEPKLLKNVISDFDTSEKDLGKVSLKSISLKTIEKRRDKLFVPVGKYVWSLLKDPVQCVKVNMFWEQYMNEYTAYTFSLDDVDDLEEVMTVNFKRNGRTLSFGTDGSVGQNLISVPHSDYAVALLDFNLCYKIEGYTLVKIGPSVEKEFAAYDKGEDNEERKWSRPYIKFISTPMGNDKMEKVMNWIIEI